MNVINQIEIQTINLWGDKERGLGEGGEEEDNKFINSNLKL